jgi:hypothetical protein
LFGLRARITLPTTVAFVAPSKIKRLEGVFQIIGLKGSCRLAVTAFEVVVFLSRHGVFRSKNGVGGVIIVQKRLLGTWVVVLISTSSQCGIDVWEAISCSHGGAFCFVRVGLQWILLGRSGPFNSGVSYMFRWSDWDRWRHNIWGPPDRICE